MGAKAFIKFDRMVGVASHDGTAGWTELLGYSWGADGQEKRPSSSQLGDFRLVKEADRLSPVLLQACANGTNIASVVLHFTSPRHKKCYVCKFWAVLIAGVDYSSPGSESKTKSETVHFNFGKVDFNC